MSRNEFLKRDLADEHRGSALSASGARRLSSVTVGLQDVHHSGGVFFGHPPHELRRAEDWQDRCSPSLRLLKRDRADAIS
jgi:hypothetical protein